MSAVRTESKISRKAAKAQRLRQKRNSRKKAQKTQKKKKGVEIVPGGSGLGVGKPLLSG
jgi:hypothetical protein